MTENRLSVLLLGALVALAPAQPDPLAHLKLAGDPGKTLPLAEGWVPPEFVRGPGKDDQISASPFWCSHCAEKIGYEKGAKHPAAPEKLLNRPIDDMLRAMKGKRRASPVIVATDRHVLVVDLPPMSARAMKKHEKDWLKGHFRKKKSKLDAHAMAHLYGLRAMHLFAMWTDLMGLDPDREGYRPAENTWGNPTMGRGEIWMFPTDASYQEFCRQFFKGFGKWSSWWYVKPSNQIATLLHANKIKDEVVHARFDHMLGHQLLFEYRGHYYHLPVWIPEGLGHHFERRHKKAVDTCCLLGQPPRKDKDKWEWKAKHWDRAVKVLVGKGEEMPVNKLALTTTSNQLLVPRYHTQAWSMINYMIGMGKGRFRTFIDTLKTKTEDDVVLEAQNNAFIKAYGVTAVEFHKRWRTWVLKKKK